MIGDIVSQRKNSTVPEDPTTQTQGASTDEVLVALLSDLGPIDCRRRRGW